MVSFSFCSFHYFQRLQPVLQKAYRIKFPGKYNIRLLLLREKTFSYENLLDEEPSAGNLDTEEPSAPLESKEEVDEEESDEETVEDRSTFSILEAMLEMSKLRDEEERYEQVL